MWKILKKDVGRCSNGNVLYLVHCDCGLIKKIRSSVVNLGISKSCISCSKKTHRHALRNKKSSTYNIWINMIQRCSNYNHISYKNYGGRGIKVCERWMNFENFLEDMGERPKGLQIDRICVDGDYEPENCRWVTPKENVNNRRKVEF